ncbi:MAG: DUF4910 domain-containing protein [Oscillospiraceae bacterium]|nr:DUF4910 domain-containing protein [Oscillospiraceae bacterium]MBQ7130714.1 DUF4910 domain-containing protein [Oscillospiraceae bacterium]
MYPNELMKILEDNAYVRTGGSPEELRCAHYLQDYVSKFGLNAQLQPFDVPMAKITRAELTVDGVSIPCTGYLGAGNYDVEAPIYYLRDTDPISLANAKGKLVLLDSFVGYWKYQDLLKAGVAGYITCNGSLFLSDRDIDQKEQRTYVHQGNRMPAVNIHAEDAVKIVRSQGKLARIVLEQEEWVGQSHNVVVDIPGEVEDYIAFTAHYDSTHLSIGVYDNLSGVAGLLYMAEYFAKNPQHYSLRFLFCGSEERGLLGAKAYCASEENIQNCILNINLDMIGCLMGKFISCVSAEEKMVHYISAMSAELGFQNDAYQGIYSSDSTPFADKNVPAVSFARNALRSMAGYHDRYDILDVMSGEQMQADFEFVLAFAKRMAAAKHPLFAREMPENIRAKLDNYLGHKRMK